MEDKENLEIQSPEIITKKDEEFKLQVPDLSRDLLEQMMSKCRINPTGSLIGKQDDQLVNWKYWFEDDGRCHVVLPKDLETYADSWPHIVGVIAANLLQATLHLGKPSEDLGFTSAQDSYLHGIGSALKQKQIEYQKVSGSYLQGYGWVASHAKVIQDNPEWFRTRWTNPLVFLTGKKVWNQAPGGDKGRWYNLVLRAARMCSLSDPLDWIISYPERKRIFVKESWSFQKGACFTESERKAMEASAQIELVAYQQLCEELKKPGMDTIESFKTRLDTVSKELRAYDAHVGAIATQRTKYLYSPKLKKLLGKGAWLLSDRLDALSLQDFIECSNATGLLFSSREHIPLRFRDKDMDTFDLLTVVRSQHYKINPKDTLGDEWFTWIEHMLQRMIDANDAQEAKR